MLQKKPPGSSSSSKRTPGSAARRGRRGGGGGREQGSRRWRAEERFFGKKANPITGSGAARVSLAALKSHFNCLSRSTPFCRFLLLFSSISTHHGRNSVCFLSQFARFQKRGRAIFVYHRQNTLSPFSCVMSKCGRSLQPRRSAAYQACAEQQQPALIRSAFPSVPPETPAATNG